MDYHIMKKNHLHIVHMHLLYENKDLNILPNGVELRYDRSALRQYSQVQLYFCYCMF